MTNETLTAVGLVLKEKLAELTKSIAQDQVKIQDANDVVAGDLNKKIQESEDALGDVNKALNAYAEVVTLLQKSVDDLRTEYGIEKEESGNSLDRSFTIATEDMRDQLNVLFKAMGDENTLSLATIKKDIATELLTTLKGIDGEDGKRGAKGKTGGVGADGIDGKDGKDGIDSGAHKSIKWIPDMECHDTDLLTHKGGLWRCKVTTKSEPSLDDDRWVLLTNGIHKTSVTTTVDKAILQLSMTDGRETALEIEIPAPNYINQVWKSEDSYSIRDVVWKDGHSFIALKSDPEGEPGKSAQWAKHTMRGRAGRRGAQGLQGVHGKRGSDGSDGPTLAEVEGVIKALFNDEASSQGFKDFRGDWELDARYTKGDVVRMGGGLFISLGSHQGKPPASAMNAGEYWATLVPPHGIATGGGGSTAPHRHTGVDVDVVVPFATGVVRLSDYLNIPYIPVALPDEALSVGSLRHMIIGRTYNFPTEKFETSPGSGVMMDIAKTSIIGIPKTNHHYINACIIRTGVHTWIAEAEEHTGTNRQPTIVWSLDLDPAWADHDGIGDIGARSFTSITTTIIEEIGDSTRLGADTLVERLLHEETERHTLSTRIATLEGGAAQQHADVVQDFKLQVNNQGLHYCIINDRPANPDHIGTDLFDGNEHKVALEWDAGFDPAHVIDAGNTTNWLTGSKPNVWLQKGSEFKQLVDPTSMQVLGFVTIKSFIDAGTVLTVKWELVNTRLDVLKVQAPSVHVVTTPDHQPLQVGGQVDAKSMPFVSLNATQQTAVKMNSLWMNETQELMWRDNAGADHKVSMSPH